MSTREQINEGVNRIGHDIKAASRNLWLAGLGAVGAADEMGRKVFSDCVRRGEKVEDTPEELMRRRWRQATGRVKALGDRVESRIEEGMSDTLNRLGAPARRDVEQLSDRLAALTKQVEALR